MAEEISMTELKEMIHDLTRSIQENADRILSSKTRCYKSGDSGVHFLYPRFEYWVLIISSQ